MTLDYYVLLSEDNSNTYFFLCSLSATPYSYSNGCFLPVFCYKIPVLVKLSYNFAWGLKYWSSFILTCVSTCVKASHQLGTKEYYSLIKEMSSQELNVGNKRGWSYKFKNFKFHLVIYLWFSLCLYSTQDSRGPPWLTENNTLNSLYV